jgi:hypothetical protein
MPLESKVEAHAIYEGPAKETQRRRNGIADRFSGSALWALSDQAVVSGGSFLTNITIARLASPDIYGFSLSIVCMPRWSSILFRSEYRQKPTRSRKGGSSPPLFSSPWRLAELSESVSCHSCPFSLECRSAFSLCARSWLGRHRRHAGVH